MNSSINDPLINFYNDQRWIEAINLSQLDDQYLTRARHYLRVELMFLYFIFFTGSVTNIFVLLRISSRNGQKSGSHILLINLVVIDLMIILFKILPDIIWCQTISWNVGELSCKLVHFVGQFSLYSSCYILVCISYNRYYLLKKPHIFLREKQRAYKMLKIAYTFSGLLSSPQLIIRKVVQVPDYNILQCVNNNYFTIEWHWKAFNFYYFFGIYLIPLQMIIILYARLISSLNLEKYLSARLSKSSSSEEKLSRKTNYMLKTKRQTISTFLSVTISFIICWTPYSIIGLMHTLTNDVKVDKTIEGFCKMMALLTPTLNPIVHANYVFAKLIFRKHKKPCPIPTVRLKNFAYQRKATGSNIGLVNDCSSNNNDKDNVNRWSI